MGSGVACRVGGAYTVAGEAETYKNIVFCYSYKLLVNTAGVYGLHEMDIIENKLKVVVHKSCKSVAAHGAENVNIFRRQYLVHRLLKNLLVNCHQGGSYPLYILRQYAFYNIVRVYPVIGYV